MFYSEPSKTGIDCPEGGMTMGYRIRYGKTPRRMPGLWKAQAAAAAGLLAGCLLFGTQSWWLRPREDSAEAVMAQVLSGGGSLREAVVAGCREVLLEGQD